MKNKQEIITEVCELLNLRHHYVSSGSTEPREFLVDVAVAMGYQDLVSGLDKHEIGKLIVVSIGLPWTKECESNGSTVTRAGLNQILAAVKFITAN